MPITSTNVTVPCQGNGTGAVPVSLTSNIIGSATVSQPVSVYNPGVGTLWVGGSSVTPSNGVPIVGGATASFTFNSQDQLYGIFNSVTTTVNVMKGNS